MGKKRKKKGSPPPPSEAARPPAPPAPPPERISADAGATPVSPAVNEATPVVVRPDVRAPAPGAKPPDREEERRTGGSDRRLFRRVPFFRKVQYRFETMEDFRTRFANDLSLGGMFIKTDEPEPMGTVIYLEFDLQDGSKILSGYGKVVRVNPKDGPAEFDPGMGVEFLKFDDESRVRIKQLVAEKFNNADG